MRKIIQISTALLGVFGASFLSSNRVVGTDMAPSFLSGDRVWISPWAEPLPGDVVVIQDPLDPNNTILRRVLAIGGQTIRYDEDTIRVGNRRLRKQAMGDSGDHLVAQETLWAKKPQLGHQWLTQQLAYPGTRWSTDPVVVPDEHLYLLADNRDRALDSRWWGAIPANLALGVVRLRLGAKHTWRTEWEWTVGTAPIRD